MNTICLPAFPHEQVPGRFVATEIDKWAVPIKASGVSAD